MSAANGAGHALLRFARESISEELGGPRAARPEGAFFDRPGATFVTLTRRGRLHGCIGSIEAARSIAADVQHNAVAAAFWDPRSFPLQKGELDELRVEISLLSPLERVPAKTEAEAIAQIRPHIDGVVIRAGNRRGTFLPQVWEKIPRATDFFAELKMKAGLPGDGWPPGAEIFRFSVVEKWSEPEATNDR